VRGQEAGKREALLLHLLRLALWCVQHMLLHLQLRCCCWCWGVLTAHQGLGSCLAAGLNGRCLKTKQQLLHLLDFVQLCLLHPCCCLQMLGLCKEGTVMTVTSKGPAMQRS
jgi:hypothetical protein